MHDKEIYEILKDLGVPAHLKGFAGIRECVNAVLEHPEYVDNFVKEVYGTAAAKLGSTAPRIERAARHAIDFVFQNTEIEVLEKYFGHTICARSGKVTNKCFIVTIADHIKMEV